MTLSFAQILKIQKILMTKFRDMGFPKFVTPKILFLSFFTLVVTELHKKNRKIKWTFSEIFKDGQTTDAQTSVITKAG